MIGREFRFHNGENGAALAVRVIKDEKGNQIIRVLDDGTVLVGLKDDRGDINKKIIKILSTQLKLARKKFDVIAGEEGEDKLISILDIKPAELQELIVKKVS